MNEKELLAENLRLKEEIKKKEAQLQRRQAKEKVQQQKNYVTEQIDLFNDLFEMLKKFPAKGKGMMYFFERKRSGTEELELVFKLNLFVSHLMEFKLLNNPNINEDKLSARLSMDKTSLISHLQEGRVVRRKKEDLQTS